MQVTVQRPMLFLGKHREVGEVIDSKDEPKLAELSPQVRRTLVTTHYLSEDELQGNVSERDQYFSARLDKMGDEMKRIVATQETILTALGIKTDGEAAAAEPAMRHPRSKKG